MTRREEIEQQTFVYYETCSDEDIAKQKGFIDGAKWADKTMIDRACEWLKSRISVDAPVETNENGEPLMGSLLDVQMERLKLAEEFIEDFRQAMKGE